MRTRSILGDVEVAKRAYLGGHVRGHVYTLPHESLDVRRSLTNVGRNTTANEPMFARIGLLPCCSVFAKLRFLEQTLPRVVPLSRRTSLSDLVVDELMHRYLKVRHLGRGSSDHVFQGREGGGQTVDLRRNRADAPFYRTDFTFT